MPRDATCPRPGWRRALRTLLLAATAAAACRSGARTAAGTSDEAAVRAELGDAAPASARVRPWSGAAVPGARLYTVEGADMAPIGVAVVERDGQKVVLRGDTAFRELLGRAGRGDPARLAELSVELLEAGQAGARVISDGPAAGLPPELARQVAPPALAGDVLTYWRWPVPVPSDHTQTAPVPSRCQVPLDRLVVVCTVAE